MESTASKDAVYMYCKVRWNGLNQYLFDKLVFDKCIDANNVLTTFYVEMFIWQKMDDWQDEESGTILTNI